MLKGHVNTIAILDLGSAKTVCIIAKLKSNGRYEIAGIGYTRSEGIKAGMVIDIALVQNSILSAVAEAEKVAGAKASKAYVAISSCNLLSQYVITGTSVGGRNITNKDLQKLLLDGIQSCKNQQLEVIHTFACDYLLDDNSGILNPVGMYGNKLSCKFHVLSTPANNLLNLHSCVAKAGVEVDCYISSAYAAGLACLTKDEIETGVTLIDLGAGVTSLAVFENQQLVNVDAIPIGGNHITNDIAKILCLPINEAERIKNLYGGVIATDLDKNEIIEINSLNDEDQINRSQLVEIIQARVEEMTNIIEQRLQRNKISTSNKIVITGGVARTLNLKEFLAHEFNTKASLGYPKKNNLPHNQSQSLELSTALGVLIHINDNIMGATMDGFDQKNNSLVKNLIEKFKKHFILNN